MMKKLYLYTFGCKINQYETQLIRENYEKQGYNSCSSPDEADTVIINSCTVTGEADRQCRQLIRRLIKNNPAVKIYVTGCYAVRSPQELSLLSPTLEVCTDKAALTGSGTDTRAITVFDGHSRAFVKIQDGCDAFCSYCIVPYVRSALWSRSIDEIIKEVRGLVDRGYPEVILSGIRLGRFDGGLVTLLEKLLRMPGEFRIRLSSLEIWEVDDALINLMQKYPEKICRHLHLPLQSGSDHILKLMNRPYAVSRFVSVVEKLYRLMPDISISTDVIVGFPGERDEDFTATLSVITDCKLSRLHVFKYSSRPGTKAASLPGHISDGVAAERSKILRDLDIRLQEIFWRKHIGTVRSAVPEGQKNTLLTDNYIRLNCSPRPSCGRQAVRVKIGEKDGVAWADMY